MKQPSRQVLDGLRTATIGIIGDRNPGYKVHVATEEALSHVPGPLPFEWIPTDQITGHASSRLSRHSGLLISPGSPYRSMEGALAAIQYAREHEVPLLGTCGGFQHMVVEFARNVLAIRDAEHQETSPQSPRMAVTALSCSLAGQEHRVKFKTGSRVAALYGEQEAVEPFFCNYGLNPEYRPLLESHGFTASGLGEDAQVRVLELAGHPFFIGTLYVPQARSRPDEPHPLLCAFAAKVRETAGLARQSPA